MVYSDGLLFVDAIGEANQDCKGCKHRAKSRSMHIMTAFHEELVESRAFLWKTFKRLDMKPQVGGNGHAVW
jgi:hypothetical protein